jgi:adenylate cyclase
MTSTRTSKPLTNRLIAILTSLLFSLAFLGVAVSGTILIFSIRGSTKVAEELSRSYLAKTADTMESRLEAFFYPVSTLLQQIDSWAKDGLLNPQDEETFRNLLIPVLKAFPQITSIATGDENGFSHRIGFDEGNFQGRICRPAIASEAKLYQTDSEGKLLKEWEEVNTYNACTRDWYLGAAALPAPTATGPRPIFWTKPFILHTSRAPGIAASVPLHRPDGTRFIITFNLMLTKVSDFSTQHVPSPNGKTMILGAEGEVLGLPQAEKFSNSEKRGAFLLERGTNLPQVPELGLPLLQEFWDTWKKAPGPFRFSFNGEDWWGEFRSYPLDEKHSLWIGVTVPEEDFLVEARKQRRFILFIAVLALVFSMVLGFFLARMYSEPLAQLVIQSEAITNLDLSPKSPVDTHLMEIYQLTEAHERMHAALDSFSRYVPTEVVRKLLERGEAAKLGARMVDISVMFCDVRGFTTISEALGPEALSELISKYFEQMMNIIISHHGTIDKMIGDAIMVLWGVPNPDPDQQVNSVRACLACAEFLKTFNAEAEANGKPRLDTGFGITFGSAMVGNFGSPNRMNYTAIGDTVNMASRLEGINKQYGTTVLAIESVKAATSDTFVWRLVDLVAVKGKHHAERIYEALGETGHVKEADLVFAASYERAFQAYLDRNFGAVDELLAEAKKQRPKDLSVTNLIEAAKECSATPPPADWNGVRIMRSK